MVACCTPAVGRDGATRTLAWKFEAARATILEPVAEGPIPNKALDAAVAQRLDAETAAGLGKLGWHVVTVKLELEVPGEIERLGVKEPQQIKAV